MYGEVDEVRECAQLQGLGCPYEPFQLDGMVGQEVVHAGRKQQQAKQVGLLSVGELTEAEVVEQVVGHSDLPAGALELAEVAKTEELFHSGLLSALDEVDLGYRDRWLAVGLEIDTAQFWDRGVVDRTSS